MWKTTSSGRQENIMAIFDGICEVTGELGFRDEYTGRCLCLSEACGVDCNFNPKVNVKKNNKNSSIGEINKDLLNGTINVHT